MLLIIILLRMICTEITVRVYPDKKPERLMIMLMMPRGLASAVLATLPAAAGITGTKSFVAITFAVIIATNILLTAGMFFFGSGSRGNADMGGA
jgi:hypothetical protein